MDPKAIAERYFAAIKARNIGDLMALYADDATLILPNGKESKGVAAIHATHQGVFNAAAPTPLPQAMIVGDAAIAVEVEARMLAFDHSTRTGAAPCCPSPTARSGSH
jgi:ketosteroid isomerase-like protein